MPRLVLALGLLGLVGCASNSHLALESAPPVLPVLPVESSAVLDIVEDHESSKSQSTGALPRSTADNSVQPVGHNDAVQTVPPVGPAPSGTLMIDGHEYQLQRVKPQSEPAHVVTASHSLAAFQNEGSFNSPIEQILPVPLSDEDGAVVIDDPYTTVDSTDFASNTIDLNLPSALAMVGGDHPAVGFAQWRVREAYAQLERAEVLWLPSIQTGFSFHRHDGNYQASDGTIVDVNRNSFQYGLGTGATGAGTTPRPGLVAQFHLADTLFQPKIAKKTAWARGHAAKAVLNTQMLHAALAYNELLDAHQDARIIEESRSRTADLSKITSDFAQAGEGLQADADRMRTELTLIDNRMIAASERIALASARLAQAISIDASSQILPMDVAAVPIELITAQSDKSSLIGTGLAMRPELKESQALVAAACEAFKREKYSPFVPSVLLGYSTGGFGGGLGNNLDNVDGRYDFDALMSWEVRNLGFGERAARRESFAQVQQAKFEKLRVMDQVALEISEAYSRVEFRRQQMEITQQAIQTAEKSYQANSERIHDGEGLPIEVLQAVQALESAQRAYLRAVIEHNQGQFRLQWALGWPVSAPANGVSAM
ncbi:Outer membrane efflux protein [Planctomycetes bacterium CA13]|uniref:Outer membrane efflux protein n=1 Tax=Novipirellula herctigrandis TaxID=2527986 RepID=A0A5C5Z913_9BACT|nr:Outer membrane efflux protein [Planctomycetes bacterium CA13]